MITYVVEVCRPIPEAEREAAGSCWGPWETIAEPWKWREWAVGCAEAWEHHGYRARIRREVL